MKHLIACLIACAPLPALAADPHCNAPVDINTFYGQDHAAVFEYGPGTEVQRKLIGIFGDLQVITRQGKPTMVYVGLDLDDNSTAIFFYAASGCYSADVQNFDRSGLVSLFTSMGEVPPFGSTFNQMPGAPGGVPGFVTGPSI